MNEAELKPYTMGRFWRAYAELYWPELDKNKGLESFAKQIADNLPKTSPNLPIRILALGFGFGGVELPIIYNLKKHTKRPIEIVAIDNAAEPLAFAAMLLEDGILSLPKNISELLPRFEHFPLYDCTPSSEYDRQIDLPGGDKLMLIIDDLDWEQTDDYQTNLCPQPSRWNERILSTLGQDYHIDVVIAAFSLFHIGWWRFSLLSSLEMLRKDGLFLHACVRGDEALFEGRPGKLRTQHGLADSVFRDTIFSHPQVRTLLDSPRGASASRPFVIDELLGRLESFGLQQISSPSFPEYSYAVTPKMSLDTYLVLLSEKGFSTFRNIARQIGDEAYEKLLLEAMTSSRDLEPDTLEIDFIWTLHSVIPHTLCEFPLYSRFRHYQNSLCNLSSDKISLLASYRREYEREGASCIHLEDTDHKKLAEILGKKLVQQGLLDDSCIALEFGFYPPKQHIPEWSFLPNLLFPDYDVQQRQVHEIALYLDLQRSWGRLQQGEAFSMTKTILDVLIGCFSKQSIYCYELGAANYSVRHYSRRDFEEIRFCIPAAISQIQMQINDLRGRWKAKLRLKKLYRSEQGRFVFNLNDFEDDNELTELISQCIRIFQDNYIQEVVSIYKNDILNMDTLAPEVAEKLAKTVTPNMVFRSVSLQLLSDAKFMAFYPAAYEVGGRVSGRDLVIALYSEILDARSLTSELHKFSTVFERIRYARQEKDVDTKTRKITSHESKNVASVIKSWPVKEFNEQGLTLQVTPESPWAPLVEKGDVALLPYYSLYIEVLSTHMLWTMAPSVNDLPFYRPGGLPDSFEKLIKLCWETIFNLYRANWLRDLDAFDPVKGLPYQPFLDSLTKLFAKPVYEFTIEGEYPVPNWKDSEAKIRWVNLSRMLFCYFREFIQHGDWLNPANIKVERIAEIKTAATYRFTLSNMEFTDSKDRTEHIATLALSCHLDENVKSKLLNLINAKRDNLLQFDPDRAPWHGSDVLGYLAQLLHDENTMHVSGKMSDGKHAVEFLFRS